MKPWRLSTRPSTGTFSCAGCGLNENSTGKTVMTVTGRCGAFNLCLGCAAELRDEFLRITEQRPLPKT